MGESLIPILPAPFWLHESDERPEIGDVGDAVM